MYTLVYRINERSSSTTGQSIDELDDRLCTIMCNYYDDYTFGDKTYDIRYVRVLDAPLKYERYEESADIFDKFGNKAGFYRIKKD